MATTLILIVFLLGYTAIAAEQFLKLNKAASALITGVVCWAIYIVQHQYPVMVTEQLMHHLSEIGSILFFLLGAMTIVELIDSHHGFDLISRKIPTASKQQFLIIVSLITFFLSALLDNLTTAIIMITLCSKLLTQTEDKRWFGGAIIIAANAGGAWSPMGDVTTTMLWIGGQITAANIIQKLLIPSWLACAVPAIMMSFRFKGKPMEKLEISLHSAKQKREGKMVLVAGIGCILFVPFFKTLTHLPPFMGMMLALGFMWVITTVIHSNKQDDEAKKYTVANALQKIDTPSILFFLGILLAVSALESVGFLKQMAHGFNSFFPNHYYTGTTLGLISSVVDNVPLVAAAQGMYDVSTYPTDHNFWEFLALTTGIGGSTIIIGSAAGVAVMGIQNIPFGWYIKKISWLALLGFAVGIATFFIQQQLM